jgi:hypothetical protein
MLRGNPLQISRTGAAHIDNHCGSAGVVAFHSAAS